MHEGKENKNRPREKLGKAQAEHPGRRSSNREELDVIRYI
jgi:hypothetical protein